MSLKLREFIKKIRACKTLDEERCLMNKESAEIRNLNKEHAEKYACRSLLKCISMALLGYSTEYIYMTCLSLLANPKFTQKRIAYLGICILLDEKSDILLLTSHTIKKDLESSNQFIIGAALNAIGEIASADVCRDTCTEVLKCLAHTNPYIKKKAALALCKITRTCPELLETVASKLKLIFEDKNHGVLISGLSLVSQIFRQDPSYIKKFTKYVPTLLKYLKNLSTTNYAPEYDVNNITDPFLQAKILEVLGHFGKVYDDENEEMSNLLGTLPTNTDTSQKNTGYAVLYELVRTIFSYDSSSGLKTLAGSILGKFLANKDNNFKYIAMDTLQDIARIDLSAVQKHKNIILEFLNDPDIAIKRKSLDLTYLIVNENNIKQIVKESLNFLNTSHHRDFKIEITTKIFTSLEKYSPSLKWEIDTILKMLCLADDLIKEDILYKIMNLIISAKSLHQYSMFRFFIAMRSNFGQEGLMRVGIYLLGELVNLIIGVTALTEENEETTVKEEDILEIITEIVNDKDSTEQLHEELMNCCFKLLGKMSDESCKKIKEVLEQESRSFYCEVQERANEYIVFTQIANDEMQKKIGANVPINKGGNDEQCEKKILVETFENEEEKNFYRTLIKGNGDEIAELSTGGDYSDMNPAKTLKPSSNNNEPKENANNNMNIFDMGGPSENNNNNQGQQLSKPDKGSTNFMDDLGELFGGFGNNNNNNNNNVNMGNNNNNANNQNNNNMFNLFDLTNMSGNNNNNNNNINNPIQNQQSNPMDSNALLNQLGNIYSSSTNNNNNNNQNNFNNNMNMNMFNQPVIQQNPSSNSMKQVYKNNDITIYSMLNQNNGNYSGAFYLSNNTNNRLTNVKLNFLVKKHVSFKVINTSSDVLEPNSSLGIKKEITMQNNDLSKHIVLKINLSYNTQGRDVSESAMINDF